MSEAESHGPSTCATAPVIPEAVAPRVAEPTSAERSEHRRHAQETMERTGGGTVNLQVDPSNVSMRRSLIAALRQNADGDINATVRSITSTTAPGARDRAPLPPEVVASITTIDDLAAVLVERLQQGHTVRIATSTKAAFAFTETIAAAAPIDEIYCDNAGRRIEAPRPSLPPPTSGHPLRLPSLPVATATHTITLPDAAQEPTGETRAQTIMRSQESVEKDREMIARVEALSVELSGLHKRLDEMASTMASTGDHDATQQRIQDLERRIRLLGGAPPPAPDTITIRGMATFSRIRELMDESPAGTTARFQLRRDDEQTIDLVVHRSEKGLRVLSPAVDTDAVSAPEAQAATRSALAALNVSNVYTYSRYAMPQTDRPHAFVNLNDVLMENARAQDEQKQSAPLRSWGSGQPPSIETQIHVDAAQPGEKIARLACARPDNSMYSLVIIDRGTYRVHCLCDSMNMHYAERVNPGENGPTYTPLSREETYAEIAKGVQRLELARVAPPSYTDDAPVPADPQAVTTTFDPREIYTSALHERMRNSPWQDDPWSAFDYSAIDSTSR